MPKKDISGRTCYICGTDKTRISIYKKGKRKGEVRHVWRRDGDKYKCDRCTMRDYMREKYNIVKRIRKNENKSN